MPAECIRLLRLARQETVKAVAVVLKLLVQEALADLIDRLQMLLERRQAAGGVTDGTAWPPPLRGDMSATWPLPLLTTGSPGSPVGAIDCETSKGEDATATATTAPVSAASADTGP
eukprot:CAMPEP_0170441612 /NCGR_PEP_ID=MMETSP0117_2-20130122/46987_1 /TAXON_ID=400756 /ORGANISM="Durinskia baltica, Strain CSIRO CS-38" /LENGTH=115 /DNA_ID=CAMNT_0010702165 /DNA_START=64 /DNA_END=413 /DNA_ORIENTATION=-